ncbi:MAG: hypothetical protein ACJ8GN_21100 [Longimicrobiaceae bacterium]
MSEETFWSTTATVAATLAGFSLVGVAIHTSRIEAVTNDAICRRYDRKAGALTPAIAFAFFDVLLFAAPALWALLRLGIGAPLSVREKSAAYVVVLVLITFLCGVSLWHQFHYLRKLSTARPLENDEASAATGPSSHAAIAGGPSAPAASSEQRGAADGGVALDPDTVRAATPPERFLLHWLLLFLSTGLLIWIGYLISMDIVTDYTLVAPWLMVKTAVLSTMGVGVLRVAATLGLFQPDLILLTVSDHKERFDLKTIREDMGPVEVTRASRRMLEKIQRRKQSIENMNSRSEHFVRYLFDADREMLDQLFGATRPEESLTDVEAYLGAIFGNTRKTNDELKDVEQARITTIANAGGCEKYVRFGQLRGADHGIGVYLTSLERMEAELRDIQRDLRRRVERCRERADRMRLYAPPIATRTATPMPVAGTSRVSKRSGKTRRSE